MRLTGREIESAVATAAIDQAPGELLNFDAVAEILNRRLAANLLGRAPEFAGKHQRGLPRTMIEGMHS